MKQYLKLLMAREGKEVLGKKGSNLWVLTIVLVATFSSIAFSKGSMNYLKDKMADPFTNWVSINKDTISNTRFNLFREKLQETETANSFDYRDVLMDQYLGLNIQGPNGGKVEYLSIRFFEHLHTPIVSTILKEDNIADGCKVDSSIFTDKTLGFIVTFKALERLGYSKDKIPPYIHFLSSMKEEHAYDINTDSLGLKPLVISKTVKFVPVALPILAVVRKLPNNVDMVSANFFYEQYHNNETTKPFDVVTHEANYLHHLVYWVSNDIGFEAFSQFVKQQISNASLYDESKKYLALKTWKDGSMITVDVGGEHLPIEVFNKVDKAVASQWNENQVQRVYQLETDESVKAPRSDFLSVEFRSLNHIREFEAFATKYGISIEMEKIHSLENFNAVAIMAAILSAAMVIFSIVCIIMFLVNMLQSYFQKVQRNLGTFKAFGMNTRELTQVYIIILITIVFVAVAMALIITWSIQGILPIIGIEKEGFNYLSLWNTTTYIATAVILVSTILTVIVVMTRMLSQTPGDLIYDRN
jgi:hypothetical protein